MKSRSRSPDVEAVALHWLTFFVHTHGYTPFEAELTKGMFDATVIDEIFRFQSHKDMGRALGMIEDIVRAPVVGDWLCVRYAHYLAWVEESQPKYARHEYTAPRALYFEMRDIITQNAEAA